MTYWKDILHYGISGLLVLVGLASESGIDLPGITVTNPKAVMATGIGVLVAGLKGGWTSKN